MLVREELSAHSSSSRQTTKQVKGTLETNGGQYKGFEWWSPSPGTQILMVIGQGSRSIVPHFGRYGYAGQSLQLELCIQQVCTFQIYQFKFYNNDSYTILIRKTKNPKHIYSDLRTFS
jgi:hypothetical protein